MLGKLLLGTCKHPSTCSAALFLHNIVNLKCVALLIGTNAFRYDNNAL